jgi:hypothetical protein
MYLAGRNASGRMEVTFVDDVFKFRDIPEILRVLNQQRRYHSTGFLSASPYLLSSLSKRHYQKSEEKKTPVKRSIAATYNVRPRRRAV